jgi:hypothetical protein
MAANDDVNIRFGADINDLKGKVDEVLGVFGKLTSRFAEMAAIVGGGVAFKKFIDETITLNGEAMKLSKMLGITGEAAGTLNTALGDIGADVETYTGAFIHFNRQLRQNSDEMQAMGVDIVGLRNGQKSSNEVFVESLAIFGKYKPGIDQTQAAMKLFGRSVEDVQKLQRLANEVTEATAKRLGQSREELNATLNPLEKYNANMETAAEKNKALNLVITQEGVAATRKYKEAVNDTGDVLKGLSKTIGEGVMPHFTAMALKLAEIGPVLVQVTQLAVQTLVALWDTAGEIISAAWDGISAILGLFKESFQAVFGKDGPGAMEIFKNALRIVQALFIGFRIGVEIIVSAMKTQFTLAGEYLVRFANVAERALHFDFAGAKAAWQSGVKEHNKILDDGMQDMLRIAEKGGVDLDKALTKPMEIGAGTPMGGPKGGTRTMPIGKSGKDEQLLAAQLALKKAQNEADLALDREFLKEAQSIYDEAFKNNLMSVAQYYAAKLAIEIRGIDATLQARRQELADAEKAEADSRAKAGTAVKSEERNKFEVQALKFKTEQVKLLGDINVLEAQRLDVVRKTGAEQADAERKLSDDLANIRATRQQAIANSQVADESAALAQMRALRQIDADTQFAGQRALETKSYAATQAFLAEKRALILNDDKRALAQQSADEEAAERAHQSRLLQIDQQAQLERAKYSIQAQQSVQSAFGTLISDMLSGQKKMGDIFRQFASSIAQTFEKLIGQKFAERLFGEGTAGGKLIDKLVTPFTEAIDTIVSKWIGGEIAQTTVSQAQTAARVAAKTAEVAELSAVEAAGIASTVAAQQAASIAGVMGWASTAAAAAMASVAAIPIIGWEMAPGVGAATYATAMSFLASARGGQDEVPFDGQITELHRKEMVLSAPLAEGLRQLVQPNRLQQVIADARPMGVPTELVKGIASVMRAPGQAGSIAPTSSSAGMHVVQNFHISAPADKRTQMQIAGSARQGLSRADRNK